jgi:hypothetical protein
MYSFNVFKMDGRFETCCWEGRFLCFLRAMRRECRAIEADCGREGCVVELRKDWKERWEVVGRENENTMAGNEALCPPYSS